MYVYESFVLTTDCMEQKDETHTYVHRLQMSFHLGYCI